MTTTTTTALDLDAIEARQAKLESLGDRDATGMRSESYVLAVALAANLSAADVPTLVAEVRRLRDQLAEVTAENDQLRQDLREADGNNGFLQQHIAEIRAEVSR